MRREKLIEEYHIYKNTVGLKKNIVVSLPPHITLFVLADIDTHKPDDLFKEVTMKIVHNSNQLEVYRNPYECIS